MHNSHLYVYTLPPRLNSIIIIYESIDYTRLYHLQLPLMLPHRLFEIIMTFQQYGKRLFPTFNNNKKYARPALYSSETIHYGYTFKELLIEDSR